MPKILEKKFFQRDLITEFLPHGKRRSPGEHYDGWQGVNLENNPNLIPHGGSGFVRSASWATDGTNDILLNPDNWLISPAIEANGALTLQYYVAPGDLQYPYEHYGVYVSTHSGAGAPPASSFIVKKTETLSFSAVPWKERILHLGRYHGPVYIAFRHFENMDQFAICIDDVKVFQDDGTSCPAINAESVTKHYERIEGTWTGLLTITWAAPTNATNISYKIVLNGIVLESDWKETQYVHQQPGEMAPGWVGNYCISVIYPDHSECQESTSTCIQFIRNH